VSLVPLEYWHRRRANHQR